MITAGCFAAISLLLGILCLRRATWLDVAGYFGSILFVCLGIWSALGQARPVWFGHKAGLQIVGMTWQEGKSIWLWTRDGDAAPVAYELPWSEEKAAKAQQGMDDARHGNQILQWGNPNQVGKIAVQPHKKPPPKLPGQ